MDGAAPTRRAALAMAGASLGSTVIGRVALGGGVLATAGLAASPARPETAMTTSNVEIIRTALDAWAAGTGGPYDLLADDAVWTITGNSMAAKTYPSREAFLSEVIRPFNARMSAGLKPKVHNLYADGDTVIAFFDASGTAKDGKPYTNTYAWFLEMRDGKIVRAHAFFDSLAFDDLWTRVQP